LTLSLEAALVALQELEHNMNNSSSSSSYGSLVPGSRREPTEAAEQLRRDVAKCEQDLAAAVRLTEIIVDNPPAAAAAGVRPPKALVRTPSPLSSRRGRRRTVPALTPAAAPADLNSAAGSPLWYAYDLSAWPPLGLGLADRSYDRSASGLAWGVMPFVYDVAQLTWPQAWAFDRRALHPSWPSWVQAYQRHYRDGSPGLAELLSASIDSGSGGGGAVAAVSLPAWVAAQLDGPHHLPAAVQVLRGGGADGCRTGFDVIAGVTRVPKISVTAFFHWLVRHARLLRFVS
jgi:hypothetical protein